ncbi:MAG TPA: fibronectin type III domain-containing protein [Streptosporangiaceae bacterium]|nr:fibronectin type III domain-containing protein [Streptosporangiaceae bacterium]
MAVMVVLATAGFVIGRAESALRLQVKPGDAWLPTNKNGSVNLIDGQSGRSSAALVLKGAKGHRLIVTQIGGKVLVLDASTGLLVRINPVELLLGASLRIGKGSTVVAGLAATYVVNYSARSAQRIDPVTLKPLGPSVKLRWQPSGTAIVDKSGTLWVPAPSIGSVIPVTSAGAGRPVKVSAVGANVVMTSANGVPIAVDRTARRLTVISLAGAQHVLTLPASVGQNGPAPLLVPDSGTQASLPMINPNGSPSLVIVNLSQGTTTSAPLGAEVQGHKLGAPVQAGERIFIPDYTTGNVLVYDTVAGALGLTIPVLGHGGVFSAEVIDGIAYFNDPNGNRAVVVTPDGEVHDVTKNGPHVPTTRSVAPPVTTPTPVSSAPGRSPNPTPTSSRGTGGSPSPKPSHKPTKSPKPKPSPTHTKSPKPTPTPTRTNSPTPTPTPTKSSPAGPPLAPVSPQATAGPGYVDVTWQAPTSGGPIASYKVISPGGGTQTPTGSTSVRITGLTCGSSYSFTVESIGVDAQPVPAQSVSAKSCVAPGPPSGLTTSVSSGQITVDWTGASSTGGGTVTYTVSWGSGQATGLSGTSYTATGLANFQNYPVTVTAGNQGWQGGSVSANVDLTAGPWSGYNITRNSVYVLNIRSGPGTSYSSVGQYPPGSSAPVTIYCQTAGGGYTDPSGSPSGDIWDKIGGGYVADGYVTTPASLGNTYSQPIWHC